MKPPNKQQMAVALTYQSHDPAPRVVAQGRGLIAQAIMHESEDLVGLLMQVELDQHIPPQLYLAVAELLTWLYRLEHGEIPANFKSD